MNPVARTALLVAATRAAESRRPDRLFDDPFAERLAGDDGREVLAQSTAAVGRTMPILEVRTRWYDEALLAALDRDPQPRQIVIVAAGMDARAFRLPLPSGTTVFELDQPDIDLHTLSAPGSTVLYDLVGKTLLASQQMQAITSMMTQLGAPWLFGSDEPASLLPSSWNVTAIDPGIVGNQWGRWPFPTPPMDVPNVARGYFVIARR